MHICMSTSIPSSVAEKQASTWLPSTLSGLIKTKGNDWDRSNYINPIKTSNKQYYKGSWKQNTELPMPTSLFSFTRDILKPIKSDKIAPTDLNTSTNAVN